MRRIVCWYASLAIIILCNACSKKADVQAVVQPPPVIDFNRQAETVAPVLKPNLFSLNANIGGFYSAVPVNYSKTTKSYPLIVCIHGGGQYGNGDLDLPVLLNDGIPQLLDEGIFPPNFTIGATNYSFIVIAPQLRQFPIAGEIKDVIDYARKTYRIDSTRIYLSGLSNGGVASCLVAGVYADQIAAIVPVSGEYTDDPICRNLAKNKVAIWDFHNNNDPVINVSSATSFIASVNGFSPIVVPKLTIFQSDKHDAWTKAINPNYKENNMNIYEWMLQYSK